METPLMKTSVSERLKSVTKNLGKISIIIIAMVIGFVAGDVYHRIMKSEDEKPVPMAQKKINSLRETSVAINERNELLIIDRQNGEYEIYQDSVGQVIFRLYASQMASEVTKP
jgi:hypothetical protein